ncbi:Fe3+-citrate ABC transporter substrate-binding protein [Vibrio parahaemolyticus]|nr:MULTISPECIES: Fe3+-citrate ABC transporter substrate-binding protein [Vibrio]MCA2422243.1 Fe3+-citrate ABC transporter substrate-binding protein [Vibrio alginolyticus]MCA2446882.1 Fe3+-citrate ABC transporter substrate-binding protein [Vibrio alginolyticus]MCR9821631.1 Fe3+-citrate ABC transporter substrate-binding protein [Vibrio parahaemolyticus]MDF5109123.1 Fe3+-citrate ABC transporter substrate-binding protein [Vibrio parahaemolyticus]MDF5144028.1 Fe3+-citrate ABC transporter substrate-
MTVNKSNLVSSVEHRFISKSDVAVKIHIHLPDDTFTHLSIGFIKSNEHEAIERAISIRDEIGENAWGKYWKQVLADRYIFTRLPHTLEPKLIFKPRGDTFDECYLARFPVFVDGKKKMKTIVRSIGKRSREEAYKQTKNAILDGYKDEIDIMLYMGRITANDLFLTLPDDKKDKGKK